MDWQQTTAADVAGELDVGSRLPGEKAEIRYVIREMC